MFFPKSLELVMLSCLRVDCFFCLGLLCYFADPKPIGLFEWLDSREESRSDLLVFNVVPLAFEYLEARLFLIFFLFPKVVISRLILTS